MIELFSIELPCNLTNNNNGQSRHFGKSASDRKKFERMLRRMKLDRNPFEQPVVLHVTRILGPRQKYWDSDSVGRGNFKQLLDAAVAVGWFYDDSYKYIKHTAFFQEAGRRAAGPAVLIEVFAAQ